MLAVVVAFQELRARLISAIFGLGHLIDLMTRSEPRFYCIQSVLGIRGDGMSVVVDGFNFLVRFTPGLCFYCLVRPSMYKYTVDRL